MSHAELFAVHVRRACAWLARSLRYAQDAEDAACSARNRKFYTTWVRKCQRQASLHYVIACRYLHAVADENGEYSPRTVGRARAQGTAAGPDEGVYRCYG